MKLFGKLLLAILIIGLLLPFTILKGKDGNALMNFSSLKMPNLSLPEVPDFSDSKVATINTPAVEGMDGKDLFYKWFDAEGNLQFTTSPPPEGVEFTVKGFDPNTNVIQSVKVQAEKAETISESEGQKKFTKAGDIGNPYSPEKIEKLIDDANNIEKLLNNRLKQQETVLGQ